MNWKLDTGLCVQINRQCGGKDFSVSFVKYWLSGLYLHVLCGFHKLFWK